MLKVIKHGAQYPKRKFECMYCQCKFKTDEYKYFPSVTFDHQPGVLVNCPECGEQNKVLLEYHRITDLF